MYDPAITIEEIQDAAYNSAKRILHERVQRNWDWLAAHWPDLLPEAYGKFLAIADEEGRVFETLEEALSWVRMSHPEDNGHIVQYVRPPQGPRWYGLRLVTADQPPIVTVEYSMPR